MKLNYVMIALFLSISLSCSKQNEPEFNNSTRAEEPTNVELLTLKSGVIIKKVNDDYIYQGDILLSKEDYKQLDETGTLFSKEDVLSQEDSISKGVPVYPLTGMLRCNPEKMRALGINEYRDRFWTMLRYTFSPKLNWGQVRAIQDAISYMESVTNVRFYNATGEPTYYPEYNLYAPYVEFTPSNDVNQSQVGRQGGKQLIRLVDFQRGKIVHEICHSLGMFHEQCKENRDDYITVYYSNIDTIAYDNFEKIKNNYYQVGYFDFNSIMMYGSYAFSIDPSLPTITKKDGSTFQANRDYLSEQDRQYLNYYYLPFKARKDVCLELDSIVYDENNNPLRESERLRLEEALNRGRCSYPLP